MVGYGKLFYGLVGVQAYVYSDKYISDEDAKEEFKQFIKDRNYDGQMLMN